MTGPMSAIKKFDNASQNNTSTVINNEEIKKIITQLETDLVNGTWTHKDYGKNDMKIMPALITQANNKYPEMNAHYILYPRDLSITIKRTIEKRIKSARFIISMGSDGIHFAVIDYKHINNNTSVILFEPAKFKGSGASLLALRARMSIQRNPLPDCHFSVVEMDIQRSSSECGIFSLALAKKLYLEQDSLLKIHEDNIKGILYD
ncbi:Effector protein YopJ, partial [Erwinia sp. OLTSP20]